MSKATALYRGKPLGLALEFCSKCVSGNDFRRADAGSRTKGFSPCPLGPGGVVS